MKNVKILALVAMVVAMMYSCGNKTPKADLKNEIDTLSYAMGLAQTQGLRDYLIQRVGIDSTYIDQFIQGLNDGVNAGDNKKKMAYYEGVRIGQQIANQMIPGISQEVFGGDSTKTLSLKNFMAGFVQGATAEDGIFTVEEAQRVAQDKMQEVRRQTLAVKYADNKEAGKKFLEENAKKEGVVTLPSGVQYKVVKEGTGALPADTSIVKVQYEGRTVDGEIFDTTWDKEPATLRLNGVIKGWTETLVRMPVGSEWEIYVPEDMAYGDREMGKIKPFSTLIFKVKLLGIEKNLQQQGGPRLR